MNNYDEYDPANLPDRREERRNAYRKAKRHDGSSSKGLHKRNKPPRRNKHIFT